MITISVHPRTYSAALSVAWSSPNVAASCTDYRDPASFAAIVDTRLDLGVNAGYVIAPGGELVGLYSSQRGHGDDLVSDAIANGAVHLDCFDGYLVTLYQRHGFERVTSLPNWTPDGPDVVYMALPGHWDKAMESAQHAADYVAV